jgi:hypothetical protein
MSLMLLIVYFLFLILFAKNLKMFNNLKVKFNHIWSTTYRNFSYKYCKIFIFTYCLGEKKVGEAAAMEMIAKIIATLKILINNLIIN